MEKTHTYILSNSIDLQSIIDDIAGKYPLLKEASYRDEQLFFDTFDWRLFHQKFIFFRQETTYFLKQSDTDEIIDSCNWQNRDVPKFWWHFPDGPLKLILKEHLGVRALIPLAAVDKTVTRLHVLNEDQKTIIRVFTEMMHLPGDSGQSKSTSIIKIQPVRGYEAEYQNFLQNLSQWVTADNVTDEFLLIMHAVGKMPGDYSTSINVHLLPAMSARDAVIEILQFLLKVIKKNIPGIIDDIDVEFLHDFRVAMRRTRSVLGQLKGVFPGEKIAYFQEGFRSLCKLTNRMRDLDVYILKRTHYQHILPEQLRPGLDTLFEEIVNNRQEEYKKISEALTASTCTRLINEWERYLSSAVNDEATKNSQIPVMELARKSIHKKYYHVLEIGHKIDDHTPASELHRLRIECKKLRYLLEFFSSLFPGEQMTMLIKQLKKLQDNLGDHNDFSVQQASLKDSLEQKTSATKKNLKTAAAIGGLIANLSQQQQHVRQAFTQTFRQFSQHENIEIVDQLFRESITTE